MQVISWPPLASIDTLGPVTEIYGQTAPSTNNTDPFSITARGLRIVFPFLKKGGIGGQNSLPKARNVFFGGPDDTKPILCAKHEDRCPPSPLCGPWCQLPAHCGLAPASRATLPRPSELYHPSRTQTSGLKVVLRQGDYLGAKGPAELPRGDVQ